MWSIFKTIIIKSLLPILGFLLLTVIAISLLGDMEKTSPDYYILLWTIIGVPFGIIRMKTFFILRNGGIGETAALFVFNFMIAGIIGGFIALYKCAIAFFYLLKGIYDLVNYSNNKKILDKKLQEGSNVA
ncbi:hypothetical protein DNH61_03600 [Paenibacillus sambharensis]|uniref:Uncharacterized protein n=1 Tax=Paenibacillus sambharensis TaxID=1803190 RepID=A0A2W1LEJ3_9BACL|nr:DUF6050 family protein [Paenibacillus sambharensis]PZD97233.1 hypothetical protein DNH61_03600 [Paenibacillus sambharensis]